MMNFEIYVKHPETGVPGWDIVHVRSTRELIESYPHFDCIITVGDVRPMYEWDGQTVRQLAERKGA